ncbi:MAG: hydantoinase/oxoprolinase family protein [Solirubrobacterales bacterium]
MVLGVDVGGTFTDAALHTGDRLFTAKVPTTPGDESAGVMAAIRAVCDRAGTEPAEVSAFTHGMTVGTNALLEERGAPTALVATEGFTDLLDIARQDRPALYHLCQDRPAPLVPDQLRFGAAERMGPKGVVAELSDAGIDDLVERLARTDAESIALCLLFAFRDATHEQRIASALRSRLPELHVSASHEVLPRFREYERCSTTVIDAYLSPLLGRYLGALGDAAREADLPEPTVMRSSGGVATLDEASRAGAWSVLSGPAGGAVGARVLAAAGERPDVVGVDMGGTSTDVCVVENGDVRRTAEREIAGRVLQLPMIDIHTVGAGGGSIGWADAGGALRVGPRSAGADPGPACYGRGGTEPTVTDANLVLGYLPAGEELAGGVRLDAGAAERALERLADELGMETLAAAEGIVRVANQEMVRALRVMTVERGVDPRRFALLPFGGAGPLHAAALADELQMLSILCPRASGVLSAFGLICSERRRDTVRTVMLSGAELTPGRLASEVAELRRQTGKGMPGAQARVSYAMRYAGQAFELTIDGHTEPDPDRLAAAFHAAHEERYGYRDAEAEVELVDIHLAMVIETDTPSLAADPGQQVTRDARQARFSDGWHETAVLRGEPAPGLEQRGPAIFELPDATLLIPPGWSVTVDERGTLVATPEDPRLQAP